METSTALAFFCVLGLMFQLAVLVIPKLENCRVHDDDRPGTCKTCEPGWNGTYCRRENIAYRGKNKRFQDDNFTTCPRVNRNRTLGLQKKRTRPAMIYLYPKALRDHQLKLCWIEGCGEGTWISDRALRMTCDTAPRTQKKRLTINCTNSRRAVQICEVQVYEILPTTTTSSIGTTTANTTSVLSTTSSSSTAKSSSSTTTSSLSTTKSSSSTTPSSSTTKSRSSATPSSSTTKSSSSATPSLPTTTSSLSTTTSLLSATTMPSTLSSVLLSTTSMLNSSVSALVTSGGSVPLSKSSISRSTLERTDVTKANVTTKANLSAAPTSTERTANQTTHVEDGVTTNATGSSPGVSDGGLPAFTEEPLSLNSTQQQVTDSTDVTMPESTAIVTRPSSSIPDEIMTTVSERGSVAPSAVTTGKHYSNWTSTPTSKEATSASTLTTAQEESTASTTKPTTSLTDKETTPSPPSTPTKSVSTPETSPTESSSAGDGEERRTATFGNMESGRRGSSRNGDSKGGEGSDVMTEVWGALGAIVVLVAVAVVAGIMYKKKQRTGEEMIDGHKDTACVLDMEMNDRTPSSSKSDEEENDYANMSEPFNATTEPIPVEAFKDHLSHMAKVAGFSREYQNLLHGIQEPVTAAEEVNGGNVRKNRFKDISPYDDTRVILKTEKESDSDYINASYIDGFAEAMAYIAAQGPLPETVGDFWHMVWTEGCSKIIMLTNLVEGGKIKCERYWPETEGACQTFGAYTVTSVRFVHKAHFVRRVLSVVKNTDQNTDSEPARELQQFHFTAWPDHGVPCPVALVRFWSSVVLQPQKLGGPMLVHCSAGIGRTGTFIALDMLTHQALTTGKVSVFPTVRRLRKQRVNMVQTVSQYKFLHEVVQEWLSGLDGDIVRDDLLHGSRWNAEEGDGGTSTQLPPAVRELCARQFQSLTELRPVLSNHDVTTAKKEENSGKNRSPSILPVEQFRVCLATADDNDSDYINAVFLPSLGRQQGYIVTQLPLDNTVADFWRMVRDWRVRTIVRFMDAPEGQAVSMYPDQGQTVQHGTISVYTNDKTTITSGLSLYTLHLNGQETSSGAVTRGQEIRMYCVQSPQALALKATAVFVSLADILLPQVNAADQPPIVLQCFEGAGPSCVLCAVLMAVESLQDEERASPFLLARLLHTARPQALASLEQYEFIVRCLVHHTRKIKDDGETKADPTSANGRGKPDAIEAEHIYGNV